MFPYMYEHIAYKSRDGLNCPSFRLAFWADSFFEILLGLPNPLMPNKMSRLYQADEPVLNQTADAYSICGRTRELYAIVLISLFFFFFSFDKT